MFQENLSQFKEQNAQVLGISVDSVFSHRAFSDSLGGLTFPLLSDFHPRGQTVQAYGLWLESWGVSKRAVIIIDAKGMVRHVQIIPKGVPDIAAVLTAVDALQ